MSFVLLGASLAFAAEDPFEGDPHQSRAWPELKREHLGANDLAWLEHSLLFIFKKQSEFGAQLWNGVIFNLAAAGNGLAGTPQAVDLNRIASPPARTDVPPFGLAQRDDIPLSAR